MQFCALALTKILRYGLLPFSLLVAAGCGHLPRAAPRPVPAISSTAGKPVASTLVVFLPGRGDRMQDFERRGLREEMERAGVRADWIAVDAHLGYYLNRSVVDALRDDVLRPARARGYRRILLVGVSLGGLGVLLCERDQRGLADGFVLIAPYLGDRAALFAEIARRGGPAAWAAGRQRTESDVAADVWTFIGQRHDTLPPIWLAWGERDRLAGGHRLLAPLLPAARVRTNGGGHTWSSWRELWRELCRHTDLFAAEKAGSAGSVAER